MPGADKGLARPSSVIVDFPTSCQLALGHSVCVRIPSLLPDGGEPVSSQAILLGDHLASDDLTLFNREKAKQFTLRGVSIGSSRLMVTQAGKSGEIRSVTVTINVVPVHSPPELGRFGKGKFKNL